MYYYKGTFVHGDVAWMSKVLQATIDANKESFIFKSVREAC